ncbi:MAG: hypothetical protein ACK4GT_22710 [Pararhodobacter sp.]
MMIRIYWHLMGRFYEARALRALNRYHQLKSISEKFFRRVPRTRRDSLPEEDEA